MEFKVPEELYDYVPNVYQKNVRKIEYSRLARQGIKLLSFDLDGTLAQKKISKPSRKLIILFELLKEDGFQCVMLSNKDEERTKKFADKLDVPYIFSHDKTRKEHFQRALNMYAAEGIEKSQMAHVGNDLVADIFNGHQFGIVTCLVNKADVRHKKETAPLNLSTLIPHAKKQKKKSKKAKLEKELAGYTLWRRHHKYEKNDQYYQLGEEAPYIGELTRRRFED